MALDSDLLSSGISSSEMTADSPGWKRALDITGCLLALPFLALLALFAAVIMGIASPGPIFFRQERIGYLGRRFKIFKFRTMHVGADTAAHQAHLAHLISSNLPMQKMDAQRDSRLIPGARLLRASGIDELPQIINVLRGEMSLVGPRPCLPYEYEQYSSWQRQRFHSVPGLTGLWQVSGKNRTTFEEMIHLDISYARRRSLWLDLKIIALTIPTLLGQIRDACLAQRRAGSATRNGTSAGPLLSPETNPPQK